MSKIPYLKQAGDAGFIDSGIEKIKDLITQWDGQTEISGPALLGTPLSKPSISHSGASFAPATIRKALEGFTTYNIDHELNLTDTIYDCGDIEMHVTNIEESQQRIEQTVKAILTEHPNFLPIILGGDHSVSCPSIKAFSATKGKIGVIQFDAHHDLRNLEDGGPSNGTPFRGLIQSGALLGENLVQIGIRSFSNSQQYHQYGKENGVTIYTMRDVNERGIHSIIEESLKTLRNKVDAIYVSVDMDVLDQAHAPGCPAIGPGGMDSGSLLHALFSLGKENSVKGMDIVEIDPTKDFRDMTSRVAAHVILQFLSGKQVMNSTDNIKK